MREGERLLGAAARAGMAGEARQRLPLLGNASGRYRTRCSSRSALHRAGTCPVGHREAEAGPSVGHGSGAGPSHQSAVAPPPPL